MDEQKKEQVQPKATPAQPIVSAFATVQSPGGEGGQHQPNLHREPLQDVLPQINELAQKVGGIKRLAELVNSLVQAKE